MPRKGSGPGYRVNAKGYHQITRRGPDYGKLVHRKVMAGLCREWCYWPLNGDGLPESMEVHHQDFGKGHNCPSNLILLDPVLHLFMDRRERGIRDRCGNGRFGVQSAPPVGAVVVYEEFHCRDCGAVRRVPSRWYSPEEVPDWVL